MSTTYPDRYGAFSQYAPRAVAPMRGLGCTHQAPQSCPTCADKPSGAVAEAVPPCMRHGFDPDAAHQAVLARYRETAARLGIAPYTAPYDLTGGTA